MEPGSSNSTAADERSPIVSVVMYGVGGALVAVAAARFTGQDAILYAGLPAVAVLTIMGAFVAGWRHRGSRPLRELHEALAPHFGAGFERRHLKGSRRVRGVPTRITLTYPATWNERDEQGRATIRDIIAKRLGGAVVATWSPPRRRLVADIALKTDTDIVESDDMSVSVLPGDNDERVAIRSRTADVVQAILGAGARVDVAFETDTDIPKQIEATYDTTTRDLSASFRDRVAEQVNSKLPGDWRGLWDFEQNKVRFEIKPPFPTNVRFPLDYEVKPYALPYAVTEANQIECWKLGSKNPHALIVGPTGSGKTVLIRNLVVAAQLLGVPVVLCDPKRIEYMDFRELPGVVVLTDPRDIAEAIKLVHAEMERRYREIEYGRAKKGGFGRILFILDEFYIFKEALAAIWAEMRAANKDLKGREHPCLALWKRMAVLARSALIHLLIGIQRPDAEFLTGLARDSFRHRVSLEKATPETAMMMWGSRRTGTDLPSVQGRAIATTDAGPQHVQVLRLLTPSDDDGFEPEDKVVWSELMDRMTQAAEQHVNAAGTDPLWFLGDLGRSAKARALGMGAPSALEPAAADYVPPSAQPDPELEAQGLESVGVYELEVGDEVELDLEDEEVSVSVLDLHFDEDEDEGEEYVELEYALEDGTTGSVRLDVDYVVTRKIAVAA
ncbi:FtsK/SpoIIIE domain-containing protein [Streptomyces sp. NPDC048623]|uniref:FtsK/SpoIIIE domain-containing protein n=1 Tax=Streptomyces sp. NPDC048623 TaxID=3155761 RepID=UPI0034220C3F